MASEWQGGPNFQMIPRGTNSGRKGGSHSGPSGRRANWFNPNVTPTGKMLKDIQEASKEYLKVHGRPVKYIISGLTKSLKRKKNKDQVNLTVGIIK